MISGRCLPGMLAFMRRRTATLVWVWSSLAFTAGAGVPAHSTAGPYDGIAVRNVFKLTAPPKAVLPPKEFPRITLFGITTLFGNKRAVLKVQPPAGSREPAKEHFYILAEGQAAGGITVLAIDAKARRVEVNNDGRIEALGF